MKNRAILSLLVLALAAGSAPAAKKQAPPPPASPRDFRVPAARRFSLENGMSVTLVPYGTIPKVTVRLAVRTGGIDEAADRVWLADLMGDLLTQGTATRSAVRIAEDAARMGGSLDVVVGADRTDIGGDVLSEFGADMVALVADVARNPKFPESELGRLKADRARQLAIARSQPQQIAAEKFRAALYPGHPYGRTFPTLESLQGYRLDQVRSFYEENFGALRSHLYVVGRFDSNAVEPAIRRAFSDWKKGPSPTVHIPKPSSTRSLEVFDRPGAVQSTIYVGMPVIDPSSRPGIVGQLEFVDLHGLPEDWLNRYVARVHAVTPEQVREMTGKYIVPEKATIVVVGDQKAIADQIAPYAKPSGS